MRVIWRAWNLGLFADSTLSTSSIFLTLLRCFMELIWLASIILCPVLPDCVASCWCITRTSLGDLALREILTRGLLEGLVYLWRGSFWTSYYRFDYMSPIPVVSSIVRRFLFAIKFFYFKSERDILNLGSLSSIPKWDGVWMLSIYYDASMPVDVLSII